MLWTAATAGLGRLTCDETCDLSDQLGGASPHGIRGPLTRTGHSSGSTSNRVRCRRTSPNGQLPSAARRHRASAVWESLFAELHPVKERGVLARCRIEPLSRTRHGHPVTSAVVTAVSHQPGCIVFRVGKAERNLGRDREGGKLNSLNGAEVGKVPLSRLTSEPRAPLVWLKIRMNPDRQRAPSCAIDEEVKAVVWQLILKRLFEREPVREGHGEGRLLEAVRLVDWYLSKGSRCREGSEGKKSGDTH